MFKVVFILLASISLPAEPLPRGIIIKGDNCSSFWGGDEDTLYEVPKGWTEVYPSKNGEAKFQKKTCNFSIINEKECCEYLGLNYVVIKPKKRCGPANSWLKCIFF